GRRDRMAEPVLLGRADRSERRHPSPHVWLAPPSDRDSRSACCRRHGVEMVPGSLFAIGRDAPTGLRAIITAPASQRELSLALSRLKANELQWRGDQGLTPRPAIAS